MSAAFEIFQYISKRGSATRPELRHALGHYEKTVDSAIRKLERLGYIERSGLTAKIGRRKSAVIFTLADICFDMSKISDRRGRPSKRLLQRHKPEHTFDALNAVMNTLALR